MKGHFDPKEPAPKLIEIAQAYIDNGISVIPLALNGTKRPAIPIWKPYQSEMPTTDLIHEWWRSPHGMGVICGCVSGGLEVLDFDKQAEVTFPVWHQLVESIAVRLPIVETPSGGYQVYYRCSVICGNTTIAIDDGQTLIGTFGEAGYITGVSSPASVDKRNYPYVQVAGPVLPEIPTITEVERLQLWRAARLFDRAGLYKQQASKAKPKQMKSRPITGNGGDFERANQAIREGVK
ncbi:MAG: bifunctional DNA primase/polymerase [Planctomycetaceae bacterium]|nr:bifunctional DNA primase/polymerase [Planctomycetaceae bacterium]